MDDMKGFSNRWTDFPDYIIGITKEIWEDRGIGTLNHYYTPQVVVRSPMGIQRGNQNVIATTMATCHEFPDRQLYGSDVIWSDDPQYGLLSSHHLITTATHMRDGQFGPASGKPWTAHVIADCAARDDAIYDEWLVRDYGGIVRQLGMDPADYAAGLIEAEGGTASASPVFLPENDVDGGYNSRGNDNEWGQKYAAILARIMDHDFNHIHQTYDRAVQGAYAGARNTIGRYEAVAFWLGLRSSFPHAKFEIHHQIGMDADMLSPRASVRWSLDGLHEGWGSFGRPTGKRVHVFGMSQAEFGPWGLRRECALYDEIAIWKQILM
jgi:hypothetical protein